MQLLSAPKLQSGRTQRVISSAETLRRVRPLLHLIGVTRLADITGMDRIGIPTYSAVVPDSLDVLSVYNGKGVTKLDARTGSIMEALERHAALRIEAPIVRGSFRYLRDHRRVLDPKALVLGRHVEYSDDVEIGWVEAHDLLEDESILVPAQAVYITFDERFGHPCYAYSTTNGLASGNVREEAICHALCELIERDAWTIAELLAHCLPAAKLRASGGDQGNEAPCDDEELFPAIDLGGTGTRVVRLLGQFRKAGLEPLVRDITSDLGISVVLATVSEQVSVDLPLVHFGLGAHPNPDVAIARALTEVAQCRAVDIQGVREDISAANADHHPYAAHTKRADRIDRRSWYVRAPARTRPVKEMAAYRHADILDDIRLILRRLRERGVGPVAVVELTRPELSIPVVRVLAGGLESWAADHGRLGARALRRWREHGGQLCPE